MNYFTIFVLFVLGCSDGHGINRCSPFSMTISDAIPIQFWINGVETYNQKEVCGITTVCFCQPFNSDDEIRIQFQEDPGATFELIIYDRSDIVLATLDFSEIGTGVYELSFIPSDISITNEQIRFEIYTAYKSIIIDKEFDDPNQAFTERTNLGSYWGISPNGLGWTQSTDFSFGGFTFPNGCWYYDGSGNDKISGNIALNQASSMSDGETLSQEVTPVSGNIKCNVVGRYEFNYNNSVSITLTFSVKSGGIVINTQTIILNSDGASPDSGTISQILDFGQVSDIDEVTVRITSSGTSTLGTFQIFTTGVQQKMIDFYIEDTLAAYSDCIDIRESHVCTTLIRYVNSKDFADIKYTDLSPTAEFYLRVPAVFFHERNTEEQERFETSGQTIVRLRDEVKVKKLLELGYMPDYMHRKLLLVLSHDTIEIEGDTWVRNDPYEKIPPANKRYPLKMANVLLTLQGYIKRNIL